MEIRNAFSIILESVGGRYLFYGLLRLKPSKKRGKKREFHRVLLFYSNISAGHTSLLHVTKKKIVQDVIKRGETGRSPLNLSSNGATRG